MKNTLITDIKFNSLDDGPGIRSVVFFKGCSLACQWCHNPESISAKAELVFSLEDCVNCFDCIESCEQVALFKKGFFNKKSLTINREACTKSFHCVSTCAHEALRTTGNYLSPTHLAEKLSKDAIYYQESKGGITISGGEPLLQVEYLSELLPILKKKKFHITVQTAGAFSLSSYINKLDEFIDLIYFDIKIINPTLHKKFCGSENKHILNNFTNLSKRYLKGGTPILARTPLVPQISATQENIHAICSFLKKNNIKQASLLSYNPTWLHKKEILGFRISEAEKKIYSKFLNQETEKQLRKIYDEYDITLIHNFTHGDTHEKHAI